MPKIYEYLIPKFLINIFKKDQSIIVKIDDLDKLYEFNYFESKEVYNKKPDISLDANDLKYCFDFEYGYNTLEVNCKAKIFNQKKMFNFFRFFYYLKDGFTQSKLISNKIALK
jgi:restriction endonuclease S subunit